MPDLAGGRAVQENAVECPYCTKWCKTEQGLSSHMRHVHPDESGCPICVGGGGRACDSHFL